MAKLETDPAALSAMRKKWKERAKPFSTWRRKGVKPDPEKELHRLMKGVH